MLLILFSILAGLGALLIISDSCVAYARRGGGRNGDLLGFSPPARRHRILVDQLTCRRRIVDDLTTIFAAKYWPSMA